MGIARIGSRIISYKHPKEFLRETIYSLDDFTIGLLNDSLKLLLKRNEKGFIKIYDNRIKNVLEVQILIRAPKDNGLGQDRCEVTIREWFSK